MRELKSILHCFASPFVVFFLKPNRSQYVPSSCAKVGVRNESARDRLGFLRLSLVDVNKGKVTISIGTVPTELGGVRKQSDVIVPVPNIVKSKYCHSRKQREHDTCLQDSAIVS